MAVAFGVADKAQRRAAAMSRALEQLGEMRGGQSTSPQRLADAGYRPRNGIYGPIKAASSDGKGR